ncbi:MAG: SDR family oxidoreductase [Sandaracinaceae bacterium]
MTERWVLVTGGTRGVGLATAEAFASEGARLVLTHAWGSADEAEVTERLLGRGARGVHIRQADVGRDDDTDALMTWLASVTDRVDVLVANASSALVVESLDDYSRRGLEQSLRYSAWPLFGYLRAIHEALGTYPRHAIAMSSDGPDHMSVGYDFVAMSKAVMETMVRYLDWHLRAEAVNVNAVRSRAVRTASFETTFGAELVPFVRERIGEACFVPPEEVAGAAYALCSGLMDAVRGQVLTVDRGGAFSDSLLALYEPEPHRS